MRVLVTGSRGFTGRFLCAELEAAGHEVIRAAHAVDASADLAFDLRNLEATKTAIGGIQLDAVVHLAAIAFVAHGCVDDIYAANIVGTRNLLEALTMSDTPPSVLLASSANIYGNAVVEPITEDIPPHPVNDYAVSKAAMEYVASTWSLRLPVTIVRPFNYTGLGQSSQFLVPKIVSHFKERRDAIRLGNIDVVRDFQDVRDVVHEYRLLLEMGDSVRNGVFNVCSGEGRSLKWILDSLSNLTGHLLRVDVDPALVRTNEVRRLVGSRERLKATLGGTSPRRDFLTTLAWMLNE
jgi:GDP-6-deoxy-D-talose 4-dehydrogenase